MDTKAVYMLSNFLSDIHCKVFYITRKEKKEYEAVNCPALVKEYNNHTGVDIMDQKKNQLFSLIPDPSTNIITCE